MAENGEDDVAKLFQEYNRKNVLKYLYVPMINFILFAYNIDLFAIYKRSHRQRHAKRLKLHQSHLLRLEPNNLDRWRRRWNIATNSLVTFYLIKFSAIIWAQVILHRHDHKKPLSSSPSSLFALICHLLGNPLIDYTGMTIFLFSIYLVSIGHIMFYLPHHYSLDPADSVSTRLWLEPAREFRRIDLGILLELDKFSEPNRLSCECSLRNWRQHPLRAPRMALIESHQIQAQTIGLLRANRHRLRPINFTLGWYKAYNWFTIYLSFPVIVIFVGSLYYIINFYLAFNWASYTFYQKLTLSEITLGLILVTPTMMLLIVIFLSECYSQLTLLQDTERNLIQCLDQLKEMPSQNKQTSGMVERPRERFQHHFAAILVMLKPLIRVTQSLEILQSGAKSLTEMVSVNMVISGTTCVCILLAEHLDGRDLRWLRVLIMVGLWFWANLTLLGCAYVFNSATKLEKITWSLLAELRLRESNKDWLIFEFQVAEQWRRLIFNRSFSDPRLSVRPFGAILNYSRALQLNFLAISFAVVLKNF